MKRINVLDEHTSNKIAAGEVVERPSSVVKELIENSIDANSKNITIEIEEGGINLIRIIDDGDGIHRDDIKKAFLPHATSKISKVEDIYSINTLGFRGEALPSIASVAKVNLKSKPENSSIGMEVIVEAGEFLEVKEAGMNKGTIMEVKDLFFNVPARKKFLKSTSRETSIISNIVTRIALAKPHISFKFFNNGKKSLHTFGTGNLKDVIRTVHGKNISDNLIYFENIEDTISVYGYIGKEEIARGSRNNQSIFVNGRYINNKTIVAAVENAFKSFATCSKFPFFIAFVDVYPEFLDVNIHPTKAEVKFKDERAIFKKVFDAVHKSFKEEIFESFKMPEENDYEEKEKIVKTEALTFDFQENGEDDKHKVLKNYITIADIKREEDEYKSLESKFKNRDKINIPIDLKAESNYETIVENIPKAVINEPNISEEIINNTALYQVNKENTENIEKEVILAKFPDLKIIGQFNKTYILCEFDSTLYIVDQHAAHEKILFEKYLKEIENNDIVVQGLLVPVLLDLTIDDYAYFEENRDIFLKSGFTVEEFGGNTVSIKEVPYFLGKLDAKNLFINIIDNLKILGSGKKTEVKYNKIASMACRAAVKGNDVLNSFEMEKLINDLRYIDDPFHCPHGRPVIVKYTSYDLDKKFRRII